MSTFDSSNVLKWITYFHLFIYTPLNKNIRPPSKMKEKKDIVYNFEIMKIRYMKDKVKRHSNLKEDEISIHFL